MAILQRRFESLDRREHAEESMVRRMIDNEVDLYWAIYQSKEDFDQFVMMARGGGLVTRQLVERMESGVRKLWKLLKDIREES